MTGHTLTPQMVNKDLADFIYDRADSRYSKTCHLCNGIKNNLCGLIDINKALASVLGKLDPLSQFL